jgi:hypothetical protein
VVTLAISSVLILVYINVCVQTANEKRYPRFGLTLQRRYVDTTPPDKLTFFLIRHGESKWNKAQQDGNITGLFNVDHSLTVRGIQQALDLNAEWQVFQGDQYGHDEISSVAHPVCAIPINEPQIINSARIRKSSLSNDSSLAGSPQQSLIGSPLVDQGHYSTQDISKIDVELQLPNAAPDGIAFDGATATANATTVVNDLLDFSFDDNPEPTAARISDIAIEDISIAAAEQNNNDNTAAAKPGAMSTKSRANLLDLSDCDNVSNSNETKTPSGFLGGMDNFTHIGSMITSFSAPSYATYEPTTAPAANTTEDSAGLSISPGSEAMLATGMSSPMTVDSLRQRLSRTGTMTSEVSIDGFLKLSRTGTMTSDGGNEGHGSIGSIGGGSLLATESVDTAGGGGGSSAADGNDQDEYDDGSESSEDEDDIEPEGPEVEQNAEIIELQKRQSMRMAEMMCIGGFSFTELRERMLQYRLQFIKSSRIYSSPFTRAIETALAGLKGHQAMVNGVTLLRYVGCIENSYQQLLFANRG